MNINLRSIASPLLVLVLLTAVIGTQGFIPSSFSSSSSFLTVAVRIPARFAKFFPLQKSTTLTSCSSRLLSSTTLVVLDVPRSAANSEEYKKVLRRQTATMMRTAVIFQPTSSSWRDDVFNVTCKLQMTNVVVTVSGIDIIMMMDTEQPEEEDGTFVAASGTRSRRSAHLLSTAGTGSADRSYSSYATIVARMNKLAADYPSLVHTFSLRPRTRENREIRAARLSASSSASSPQVDDPNKREIVLVGGMHAREWIAAEVCVGLMQALVNLFHLNAESRKVIADFEFIFVPVLNPDGYEYSRQTPNNRLWRKNRRPPNGVDLNRNFPKNWGLDSGSSGFAYDETYRGPAAASEPETQAFMSLVEKKPSNNPYLSNLALTLSFHSFGGVVLVPPGYAVSATTDTTSLTDALFQRAVDFQHSISAFTFNVDPAWALYPVSGDLIDWVHYEWDNIPCATVELRPRSNGCCQFVLDSKQIPISILEQTAFVLHAAATARNVIVAGGGSSGGGSASATPWWRDGGGTARTDLANFTPSAVEDADGDGIKDFFDPCLQHQHSASQTTSWTSTSSIANFLDSRNVGTIRSKFYEVQREMGCGTAPWLHDRGTSYKLLGRSNIFTASASKQAAWKANTPTIFNSRLPRSSSSSVQFKSIVLHMRLEIPPQLSLQCHQVARVISFIESARIGPPPSCGSSSGGGSDTRPTVSGLLVGGASIHSVLSSSPEASDMCLLRLVMSAVSIEQLDTKFQDLANEVAVRNAAPVEVGTGSGGWGGGGCSTNVLLRVASFYVPGFPDPPAAVAASVLSGGALVVCMASQVLLLFAT